MTEKPAAACSTPAELMNGCRGHQPGPTKGMANLSCCWATWHWLSKAVSTNTLKKWMQPQEVSLRKDSSDGDGRRAQPFLSCKCSFQALTSFGGTTICINRYRTQHPTLCLPQNNLRVKCHSCYCAMWRVSCYSHSRLRILHFMGVKSVSDIWLERCLPFAIAESTPWCVLHRSQQQPWGLGDYQH